LQLSASKQLAQRECQRLMHSGAELVRERAELRERCGQLEGKLREVGRYRLQCSAVQCSAVPRK
jgi:hypothetical protein